MTVTQEQKGIVLVVMAGLTCGAIVWALSTPITGVREPFDAQSHYYRVAIFVSGILAALPAPRYWWVAVIAIFLGERLYAFAMLPETRPWLLASILINLLVLTWLPAAAGALGTFLVAKAVRRRKQRVS
ncbi:MAG: hypothetical protein QNJ94_18115 [Alphaproteobacteria bacterium]|nr:hypothetical protein [Alphaproteobacteria bacterium]